MTFYKIVKSKLKKHQIAWDIIAKIARFYPEQMFKKIPSEIVIEPTNACNLRCPVCPTHFAMTRKRGFIDFNLFKSIIDDFENKKTKPRILMSFAGEPLLHKDIDKLVKYAHQKGCSTYISTNATVLNRKLSRDLIMGGLDSIHLCIEGITKKSHEAYRIGSKFEEVKNNIENFVFLKKQLKTKTPLITIQTLLTSFSEKEINKIISWARSIGANAINLKSLSMGTYTTDEMKNKYGYLLPSKKFRRKKSKINKTICTVPLRQAVVYWDGTLGLCCDDFDGIIQLPNIKDKGFINTLISPNVIKKRKMALLKKYDLCQKCSLGNTDFYGIDINFDDKSIPHISPPKHPE